MVVPSLLTIRNVMPIVVAPAAITARLYVGYTHCTMYHSSPGPYPYSTLPHPGLPYSTVHPLGTSRDPVSMSSSLHVAGCTATPTLSPSALPKRGRDCRCIRLHCISRPALHSSSPRRPVGPAATRARFDSSLGPTPSQIHYIPNRCSPSAGPIRHQSLFSPRAPLECPRRAAAQLYLTVPLTSPLSPCTAASTINGRSTPNCITSATTTTTIWPSPSPIARPSQPYLHRVQAQLASIHHPWLQGHSAKRLRQKEQQHPTPFPPITLRLSLPLPIPQGKSPPFPTANPTPPFIISHQIIQIARQTTPHGPPTW